MPRLRGYRVGLAQMRVLLTGTEYSGGLAALRALSAAGYEPWAAVSSTRAYGARSRAAAGVVSVPDPRADPAAFAVAVAHGAAHASARVVLPGTEGGLIALAAHRDMFSRDVALGACSPAATASATDKVTTLADAAEAGIDVLSARVLGVEGPADIEGIEYPVVVKPLRSELPVDGRLRRYETKRADDREQLTLALAGLPDGVGIVQRFVDGRLLTVNGVAWEGEVIAEVHAEALRTWPTGCGAVTYAQTIEPDADLAVRARALMARLGWSGVFNLQFIDGDDGLFLTEVNPRLFTSLGLAVAAGVNLPAIWVGALLGRPPEPRPYEVGVHFRSEDDIRSLAHQFRSGDRLEAIGGLLPQRNTTHAIVSLSDPRPGLAFLRRLPGRLLPSRGVIASSPPG
jgi:predicted ATP-grasp superfamily ATP-dependent carboligase